MAKKQVLQINKYSGGVNSYSDPRDLNENEFQVLDNAAVDEEGIIRVSGGLELKDNIDLSGDGVDSILSIPGKGLFSHRTDYVYNIVGQNFNFNSNLETDGADTANAWGIEASAGDGTWAFEQTSSNTNGTFPTLIGANTSFATNYDEYSAAVNYDHGSLKFRNIPLNENTNYTLRVNIVSEKPWNYLGSNIPPRIRLYSETDSLYLHPNGFTSVSDATHAAICNDNLANFIDHTDGSGGYAVTDNPDAHTWSSATHGDGSWTAADNNGVLTVAQVTASVPIASSASHTEFNSLFGTIETSGNMTNGYALKMQGANAGFFHASNTAFTSDLAVVASTEYLFDAFYFTVDEQCQVKITNQDDSYATIWDSGILDANSSWTHVSGNTDYPQPIVFTTPSGCDAIRIEVTVAASGNVAYFAGFNIRKNVYELSKLSDISLGTLFPYFNYPNSWVNQKSGSVNSSSYIPSIGANPHFKRLRKYELSFNTGYDFTDNKLTLSIENGVWGVAHETGTTVNNIMIDSVELFATDTHVVPSSEMVSSYATTRGNLIFYNKYNENENTTEISLHQYRAGNNQYEDISSLHTFPTISGKTSFNFFKSGSKILFCDESFQDKSLYTFEYNKKINRNKLSVFNVDGIDISHFENTISNGLNEAEYDALNGWLNIHNDNDAYLSMYCSALKDWFDAGGNDDTVETDGQWSSLFGYGNSFCQHSTDDGGGTSGLLTIDHDDSVGRFQYVPGASFADDEQPYAKYITIPKYDIAQSLTSTSRVGKITVDLSHWMVWGKTDIATANGSLYIPKMDIYIDVVHADVIAHDGSDYTGTYQANHHDDTAAHFIATIAHKEVNPNELIMGYDTQEPVAGTLGYDYWDVESYLTDMPGNTKRCYAVYQSNEFDTNGNMPLRVEFEFPYDFTYTPVGGSGTNLTVNASTGTNFQVRIVPRINSSMDFASMLESDGDRAKGIMSEAWRIDAIKIKSWETTQGSNISTIFSNINTNEFGLNMAFETPSEGEADGWDSDWTPALTFVDYNDIESSFGDFNFSPVNNTDVTKCPGIGFTYDIANTTLDKVKLIKGYMKSLRNPNYNLQFVIDTDKKTIKSSSSIHENDAVTEGNIIHYQLQSKYLLIPNEIDSYESETGVLSENALLSKKLTATFKTAVVANNTLYAGNVYQNGVHYPDRMIKSPIGKSPLLPSTNFIDVAINDGDEITSLQFFKDRLLQFKKSRLYIISTSEDYEYLQDTVENVGITQESQVTMTPYGIAWINSRGCYLYDGQKVNNLTDGKLAYKKWKDSESSWEIDEKYGPVIHYLKKDDKLIVYGATESLANIQNNEGYENVGIEFQFWYQGGSDVIKKGYLRKLGYQFDFKTKSWTNLTNFTDKDDNLEGYNDTLDGKVRVPWSQEMVTNFSYDENGNSILLIKPENKIFMWDDIPKQTMGESSIIFVDYKDYGIDNRNNRDFRIITKDYDFQAPSVNKKIYKVYVTFKSTELESNKSGKRSQMQDFYKSSNVGVYYAINGTNTWIEFSPTKSKNYGTKGLISDDSETTTTLSENIGTGEDVWTLANASKIKQGYVLRVGTDDKDEQVYVKSVSGNDVTVARNYNNTEIPGVYDSGSTVYISTGDWIVAELKPSSSINKIDSFKLKFETKHSDSLSNDENGVPPGFMINDISVIYRHKNVR